MWDILRIVFGVLQCVAACCNGLQSIIVYCNVIGRQCGMYCGLSSVCCSVLQRVVMGCRVLQCIATSSEGSVGCTADRKDR